MRYSENSCGNVGEVVDLGGGVTYEIPAPKRTAYRKVLEVINLGGGVTYELTSYVPVNNGARNG